MTEPNARTIYVVTGGKHDRHPDPNMTHGRVKIRRCRSKLPVQPEMVVCGTGLRHRDIANALNLTPTTFTILAGTADSFWEGKKGKQCIFADGEKVPAPIVTSTDDIRDAVRIYVRNSLPHNAVVCASKSFLRALQRALSIQFEILPTTVYKIDVDRGGHINITKL